jgi:hypothetical protein
MISLKVRTLVTKSSVPLHELVSIITDWAKSMTGQVNGFIALCRQHKDFSDFLSYHCIIHQQILASKRLDTKTFMDIASKIVNSTSEKSLQRRLFSLTLVEGAPDVIFHTDGGVGTRFCKDFTVC